MCMFGPSVVAQVWLGDVLTLFPRPKNPIAGGAMGHYARIIDLDGNLLALWTPPAKAPGQEGVSM